MKKSIVVTVVSSAILLFNGCAANMAQFRAQKETMEKEGILAYKYQSKLTQSPTPIPASVRITDLKYEEPHSSSSWPLMFFPLLSLGAFQHNTNKFSAMFGAMKLKQWEMGKLIAQDFSKNGIFKDIVWGDSASAKEFDIRGSFNYQTSTYFHFSGLGELVYSISLLPLLTLPMSSFNYGCQAHFDVVSTRTGKVIFSQDYSEKYGYTKGMTWGNNPALFFPFSERLVPELIRKFAVDLQKIPQDSWKE